MAVFYDAEMSYSKDLRERVLRFLQDGGSKVEAARLYQIGERTVYRWAVQGLDIGKPGPRGATKLDSAGVRAAVAAEPDVQQKELAARFKVTPSGMHYAFKRLRISRKKNAGVPGKKLG
jgi:transposase-like protein